MPQRSPTRAVIAGGFRTSRLLRLRGAALASRCGAGFAVRRWLRGLCSVVGAGWHSRWHERRGGAAARQQGPGRARPGGADVCGDVRALPGRGTVEADHIGFGTDAGYKGLYFTVAAHRAHVTLGIARGASLPDPAGLMEGTGKVHR